MLFLNNNFHFQLKTVLMCILIYSEKHFYVEVYNQNTVFPSYKSEGF